MRFFHLSKKALNMSKKEQIEFLGSKTSWHIPATANLAISLGSMKIKVHECVNIVEGNK